MLSIGTGPGFSVGANRGSGWLGQVGGWIGGRNYLTEGNRQAMDAKPAKIPEESGLTKQAESGRLDQIPIVLASTGPVGTYSDDVGHGRPGSSYRTEYEH